MPGTSFRADVEGLRAVAIAIVVLAHARLGLGAGGYVGVDVFFVISGFLITRLLVGELDRSGRVSVARFYARRVKRLMPQALSVIAAVVVAAWLLLSPLEADVVAHDVVAAGAYAMNWHLSAEATDYFHSGEAARPLDHLCSLAVEEQLYVVWPWLLLALAWVSRRALPVAIAVIASASFAYAVASVHAAPEAAYYSAFGRAWELGLGALLAVAPARRIGPAAAWLGLAAIAAGPPLRLLTSAPMRWLGRVSYAWYVWHWPVLVFAGAPSAGGRALVALGSLLPAWLSYRWIETPLRHSTLHARRPWTTLAAGLAGPAVVIGVGLALSAGLSSPPALAAAEAVGAPALGRQVQRTATALRPRPRDASDDRGRAYADGCLLDEGQVRSPACVYGDPRSRTTVVLFGDSHAMQWFPALEATARRRGRRLVELTKSGCPPSLVAVLYPPTPRRDRSCDGWRESALRRIERGRPALVLAGSSMRYTVLDGDRTLGRGDSTRALGAGYAPTLTRLRAAAARVAVLTDVPRPPGDIPSCVSGAMRRLRRCAFARGPAEKNAFAIPDAAARVPGIETVDATDRFCLPDLCPAVVGDVLVYRNSGHVTASYMKTLAPWLARRLRR
jgi:peptidoglycan/LPS O-acetylase OafA/YrhL